MIKRKALQGSLIVCGLLFLVFQFTGYEVFAAGFRAASLMLMIALYYSVAKKKQIVFFLFLSFFCFGDLITFINWLASKFKIDLLGQIYLIGNIAYIVAYIMLIIYVFKKIQIKKLFPRFLFHVLVLLILDIVFVVIIADTATEGLVPYEYWLEFVYNSLLMILLSLALLNVAKNESSRSMYLLVGAICIVFSEVIQMAYFYVSNDNLLNILSSLFIVAAFASLYLHVVAGVGEKR